MLADVIKDAIAAADDHVKIAQEMLAVAQNALEMLRVADGPPLIDTITKEVTAVMADDNTPAFGITTVWIGLALLRYAYKTLEI